MSLHPAIREVIERSQHEQLPSSIEEIKQLRSDYVKTRHSSNVPEAIVASSVDLLATDGERTVPVRLYTPKGTAPFPVIVYYHGGGFVVGDLETIDGFCRYLCYKSEAIVVSVDYRLAPEHPFPAAFEDAYVAAKWAATNAQQYGGEPKRLTLSGDSAGGNLAVGVMLNNQLHNDFVVDAQLLYYPWLLLNDQSDAHLVHGEELNLTTAQLRWYESCYAPSQCWKANPLLGSASGAPPSVIITAEHDPLRDDGLRYAEQLQIAGTKTVIHNYSGLVHSFIHMMNEVDEAREAVDTSITEWKHQRLKSYQ
ncbi:alpha/beta hydrolase [Geomicrobium sp. JCM 19038]|uniref:alpha/beta hydrolase n=1 Tax=Geomicrobium sp. JCM 19038 TaxID=1460635 RepID=UPI00045F296E|nr:alpha/beta hydrolase [Geomicrobium sp. JCM 19038]GAK07675.1 hypothetical protein JCM19038_1417 [Geomicrobium sp. JCM 19038]